MNKRRPGSKILSARNSERKERFSEDMREKRKKPAGGERAKMMNEKREETICWAIEERKGRKTGWRGGEQKDEWVVDVGKV